jgi:hypothetical protein
MQMLDLNDAQPQMSPVGDLLPDGAFAKVRMTIRPGGADGASPMDARLLKASSYSDVKSLDCEFTVVDGPYARRKFWHSFTVAGGKLDDKGQSKGWNISKSAFRAMIDSALGLNPKDESQAAREKRLIAGLKALDGIAFAARIMVEQPSSAQYKPSNKLANVVLPGEPQYAAIMRGEPVPPEPVDAPPRKAPEPAQAAAHAPAWRPEPAQQVAAASASAPWRPQPSAPAANPPGPAWLNS